jgi:hypothetical protein
VNLLIYYSGMVGAYIKVQGPLLALLLAILPVSVLWFSPTVDSYNVCLCTKHYNRL